VSVSRQTLNVGRIANVMNARMEEEAKKGNGIG
jgi:hypothetical protein